jgi:hypothetical protein
MGREMRTVPADWVHPKDKNGDFIPLYQGSDYALHLAYQKEDSEMVVDIDDYMPIWSDENATNYMMYEDTTEGTPISPAFETIEELAQWLTDNNASRFADIGATYDEWLYIINGGFSGLIMRQIND